MAGSFVSESIFPIKGTFDSARMVVGEPGVPGKFRWRKQEVEIAEVLETWKEHGDCTHGSGDRYVRKHGYRVRTTEGRVLKIYFQRSFGRSKSRPDSRWWLHSYEDPESGG